MAAAQRIALSDRPVVWTVVGLAMVAAGLNGFMFLLPRLAQSLKGETVFTFLVLAGIAVTVGIVMLCVGLIRGWTAARNAPVGSIPRYFRALRIPLAILLGTVVAAHLFNGEGWPLWMSEGIRVITTGLAGWFVARCGFSIWKCAVAGLLMLVLDHVVVNTVVFAVTFEWLAIGGVFISFGMFALVSMIIAAAVGFFAKWIPQSNNTVEPDAHEAARGSP
jgi:hypothetical protein